MSLKLVRIEKSRPSSVFFGESRYGILGLTGLNNLDIEDNHRQDGEFFFVDERELDGIVAILARENPGKEVQVYDLVQVSTCPPGELVTKKVSKDGVLPNLKEKKAAVNTDGWATAGVNVPIGTQF